MTDPDARPDSPPPPDGYEGSGGWGLAAMTLLAGLFIISAVATVHSILVTFGG